MIFKEPIAIEPKTATTPIVDNFSHDTLKYGSGGEGSRGIFDWKLVYHSLPKLPEDRVNPIKPSKNPSNFPTYFQNEKLFKILK